MLLVLHPNYSRCHRFFPHHFRNDLLPFTGGLFRRLVVGPALPRALAFAAAALFCHPATGGESLPTGVVAALRTAEIPPSSVSVVVRDAATGRLALGHNAAAAMNPASVMKLVTTY